MKHLTKITLLFASLILFSSCVRVSERDLTTTTHAYKIGPKATYFVRPFKIKIVDIDDTVLIFDVVSGVELINTTNETMSFDVGCIFFARKKIVAQRLVKDVRVKAKTNKLVKTVLYVRATSTNGYKSICKVKVYRLRKR